MTKTRAAVTAEQLATLSHEFRTPLNGVLGMARLLESTKLTAEQRSYVAALRESGDHLLSLVNDVLDFARLGATALELHLAPVDIEDLLRQVAELMSPRAHEKKIEIAWAVERGLPPLLADEGRLRQVLLNFAGNAVKFTEKGGVLLTARDMGEGRVRFSVADTGPGVAPEQRESIFEAFVQTDPSHQAQLGGAGLGLAIVARLAAAMDGAAGVGEAAGGGADFWFEAPFARQDETPDSVTAAPPLEGRFVAVVSPNAVVREAVGAQAIASGAWVKNLADLAQVETLPRQAVLLVDAALAGPDRPLTAPAGRAAVALLTPDQRDLIPSLSKAGFSGYLIKPLRRASLTTQVLAAKPVDAALEALVTPAEAQDDRIAPAAAPGARVLLAEDNPINALLARTLLEREGCTVDRIASGDEAVAALSRGTYDLVFMDLRMPGLNGLEATRAVRDKGVDTPILALTADAFDEDRRQCLLAGMDDFLVKPLTPAALREALSRWTGPDRPRRWTNVATRAKVAR
ncbi:MAG: response regulator [Caulobacter sp.]